MYFWLVLTPPHTGQGKNLPLTVTTVHGQTSFPFLVSYDQPVISSALPGSFPTQGGDLLTISGRNFGIFGVVTVGGQTCANTTYTHKLVLCSMPSGVGTSKPVVLVSTEGVARCVACVYPPPPRSDHGHAKQHRITCIRQLQRTIYHQPYSLEWTHSGAPHCVFVTSAVCNPTPCFAHFKRTTFVDRAVTRLF